MKITKRIKEHLIDSTALLVESTPVFAAFETGVAGMSDDISINARMLAAGLTYLGGMGYAYYKGRDLSRKLFKITDTTKERIQAFHDSSYLGAFNLVVAPLMYVASGARDLEQIVIGTGTAVIFGLVNGAPMGYALDLFRDLTGIKESARVPEYIRNKSSRFKLGLVVAITVASIALTSGIYKITPDKNQDINKKQEITQFVYK